ncbi:MAG: TspO/MBR family protein [Sedimenticolaceae bacterium]|nr:TspO/MBR family protein [Sedimenticolaceae bacterium]
MLTLTRRQQITGLIGWFIVSFAVSAVGAIASIEARNFYAELLRPEWAPPGWLFGPVWTLLFALMAISAWMVWRNGGFRAHRIALSLFLVQLVFNALWSWLFFAWRLGGAAFLDILLLWVLILATLVAFWRVQRLAGILLLPYLLWVSFAAFLNYAIWQLNPAFLG